MHFALKGIKPENVGNTFYGSQKGETVMKKTLKEGKKKVLKITEAEYEAYISALKSRSQNGEDD